MQLTSIAHKYTWRTEVRRQNMNLSTFMKVIWPMMEHCSIIEQPEINHSPGKYGFHEKAPLPVSPQIQVKIWSMFPRKWVDAKNNVWVLNSIEFLESDLSKSLQFVLLICVCTHLTLTFSFVHIVRQKRYRFLCLSVEQWSNSHCKNSVAKCQRQRESKHRIYPDSQSPLHWDRNDAPMSTKIGWGKNHFYRMVFQKDNVSDFFARSKLDASTQKPLVVLFACMQCEHSYSWPKKFLFSWMQDVSGCPQTRINSSVSVQKLLCSLWAACVTRYRYISFLCEKESTTQCTVILGVELVRTLIKPRILSQNTELAPRENLDFGSSDPRPQGLSKETGPGNLIRPLRFWKTQNVFSNSL